MITIEFLKSLIKKIKKVDISEPHLTMMEVAMMERENSIVYRGYKMSHPEHHLKVTKNKA
jgi:hypothetical protein